MPCSHRCQCWFQDDWLAGLKSLLFTSLKADYWHNVNISFWGVHTSMTAPYLWPEAAEVKGQPLSSQRAWLNLHSPRRNCPLQWMSTNQNSSTDLSFCYSRYFAHRCPPVWNNSSQSVLKEVAGRLQPWYFWILILPGVCQHIPALQIWYKSDKNVWKTEQHKCNKRFKMSFQTDSVLVAVAL